MPNYARKRTITLPLVAVAVVAAPVVAGFLGGGGQYRFSNDSGPGQRAQTRTAVVALSEFPTAVVALRELAGMPLPDLRVGDLAVVPGAPPLPEGSRVGPIGFIAGEGAAPISARTPALDAGVVPEQLADRIGAQVTELTHRGRFSMIGLTAPDLGASPRWCEPANSMVPGVRGSRPGPTTVLRPVARARDACRAVNLSMSATLTRCRS
ncbi:hypothetical protein [Lolliginicoccus levis]|uniref:hypothetical protein n=1 Tax=Lolliginicoccus levis TaxID=2919542 RepID=UPI00241CF491|nr:hypothetical protein [Lolliginicoccus levis]